MTKGVFATFMLFWVTSGVVAGETSGTGNALAGRELAGTTCAPCHVVAGDQKQGPLLKPPAQSFFEIARGPKADEWTLQTFLASTHNSIGHPANMPNPQLSTEQIRDVAAYILSLREQRKRRD
jgi:mono/diheme cytochrome c family protein